MRSFLVAALVFAVSTATNGVAQWRHFGNFDDIRALYQQGDTLWVGTNGGLVLLDIRDGGVIERIIAGDRLPDSSVRAIAGRGDGVWVGTDHGLVVFGADGTRHYPVSRSPVFRDVRSIDFGPGASVFVGTFGHGVGILRGDEMEHITKADSLLDDKVYAVAPMDTFDVYYATSLGLCAFRDSVWVGFQAGAGLPRGEVKALVRLAGEERFYTLIAGRGVYRFNGRNSIRIRTGSRFPDGEVAAIDVAKGRRVWAAGRYGGIAVYNGQRWQNYGEDDPEIAGGQWRTCHVGRDGSAYFGSADGLIVIVADGRIRKLRLPSDLPSGFVGPLVESDGRVYMVNGRKLLSTRDGTRFEEELDAGTVFDVALDDDGQPWLCTAQGLVRREGSAWVPLSAHIEPRTPFFTTLCFEPGGAMWVGAHAGTVYRYDGWLWIRHADADELAAGPIHRLVLDASGSTWAQSVDGGLHRYAGLSWVTADSTAFDGAPVVDLAVGRDGAPLALTASGLWRHASSTGVWSRMDQGAREPVGAYRLVRVPAEGPTIVGAASGVALVRAADVVTFGVDAGIGGRDVTGVLVTSHGEVWVGFRTGGLSVASLDTLLGR